MTSTTFTPSPMQVALMVAVIEGVTAEGNLKCDWNTVAKKTGYAHAKSARDQWGSLLRHMKATTTAGKDGVATTKPVTPKKSPKRKGLDENGAIGKDDEDCNGGGGGKAADRGKNRLSSVAKEEVDDE